MRAKEFLSEGFAGIPDYKTMPAYKLKKASKGKHKFFLPTDAPVPASVSALDEYKLDNEKGLGVVPNNTGGNPDYFGIRVMMKPSIFHRLALPLPKDSRSTQYADLVKKVADDVPIASPFLSIEIPDVWEDDDFEQPARVTGHEGRHRMHAVDEVDGDVPVEVHLWGGFESSEMRNRNLTDKMKQEILNGLINEKGNDYVSNIGTLTTR